MPNIIRGTIVIPFSAEVDDDVRTKEQMLDHFDRYEWQFADFVQHDNTTEAFIWESGTTVNVTEVVPDTTMDDEFAAQTRPDLGL